MHHHHSRSLLMLRVWAQVPQLRYGNGGHKCATALATLRTLCPAWNLRAKGAENMLSKWARKSQPSRTRHLHLAIFDSFYSSSISTAKCWAFSRTKMCVPNSLRRNFKSALCCPLVNDVAKALSHITSHFKALKLAKLLLLPSIVVACFAPATRAHSTSTLI